MKYLLSIIVIFLVSCSPENDLQDNNFNEVKDYPPGTLETTQGEFLTPEDLENKVIVLNIWADWCPPCIKEMPYFNKLDKHPEIQVLGFHFDQFDLLDKSELLLLIDKLEMEFANLNNDPRDIWGIELPEHVPTIMIIKDNQIVKTLITPQNYESLIEAVEI